jgi:hypothetical protein
MGTQSAPDALARQHASCLQAVATRGFMAAGRRGCLLAAANGVVTAATILAMCANIVPSTGCRSRPDDRHQPSMLDPADGTFAILRPCR